MQDEYLSKPLPAKRPSGAGRAVAAVALLAFVLGAVLVGWVAWRSGLTLDRVMGREVPVHTATAPPPPVVAPAPLSANPVLAQGGFDQRLAALEQRLALLDLQAQAASGNAGRAEGLLIAFATRRMIDRGSPLGYLEDQLKVRFADAQPNAVATIVTAAQRPVTLDQLAAQLQAMTPSLVKAPQDESGWRKVTRGVSDLFVIRSDKRPAQDPSTRIDRALILLREGRIDNAIIEVRQLPGAAGAGGWVAAAQRYVTAQRALDLIESTALIATGRLNDGVGQPVQAPSPLNPPVPGA
jgi:hypothetical protein